MISQIRMMTKYPTSASRLFSTSANRNLSSPAANKAKGTSPSDDEFQTVAPGWKSENATESEQDVKSDQEPPMDIHKLEKKTAEWFDRQKKK